MWTYSLHKVDDANTLIDTQETAPHKKAYTECQEQNPNVQ